jgi:5-methylcytosine-specific restriction endonuclease McrA
MKHLVRKRSGGVCAYCGRVKHRVAVHHIDHNAKNNTFENMVLMCDQCHDRYHHTDSEPVRKILSIYFSEVAIGLLTSKRTQETSSATES